MVYGLPVEKTQDVLDTQPIGKIRAILQALGYSYSHHSAGGLHSNNPRNFAILG